MNITGPTLQNLRTWLLVAGIGRLFGNAGQVLHISIKNQLNSKEAVPSR